MAVIKNDLAAEAVAAVQALRVRNTQIDIYILNWFQGSFINTRKVCERTEYSTTNPNALCYSSDRLSRGE